MCSTIYRNIDCLIAIRQTVMTVSRSSPKRVRLSVSVSVSSEQDCILGTRPTTFLNFGSSQDVSNEQPRQGGTFCFEEKRKSKSSSPPRRRRDVPDIIISDVGDVNEKWNQLAEEIHETSWKAKQKEKRKRAKKARVRRINLFVPILISF